MSIVEDTRQRDTVQRNAVIDDDNEGTDHQDEYAPYALIDPPTHNAPALMPLYKRQPGMLMMIVALALMGAVVVADGIPVWLFALMIAPAAAGILWIVRSVVRNRVLSDVIPASGKPRLFGEHVPNVTLIEVIGQRETMDEIAARGIHGLIAAGFAGETSPQSAQALVVVGSALAYGNAADDPVAQAVSAAADRYGFDQRSLTTAFPRIGDIPFDPERGLVTSVHRIDETAANEEAHYIADLLDLKTGGAVMMTTGAVDDLLDASSWMWVDGDVMRWDAVERARISLATKDLTGHGRRVLGVAYRMVRQDVVLDRDSEHDLVFVGLLCVAA